MNSNLSIAVVKPSSVTGYKNWKAMRLMPMGGPLIASFLKDKGYDVTFIDCDYVDFDPNDYDVVLISMLTPEAPEGYKIADKCRELGIPVIGGGYHVTFNVDEAKEHFDIVVKRDGIPIILEAINKIQKGEKGILEGEICSTERLQFVPDMSFVDKSKYVTPNYIITSFGCPHSCSFCTVWKFYNKRIFWKDRETIEREIKNFTKGKLVFILDDNITFVKPYVFRLLKEYNYKFVGAADLNFIKSDKFKLAVDCGLISVALGFEAIDEKILERVNKGTKQTTRSYDEIIRIVKDNRLALYGYFLLDPDTQTREDMKRLVDYAINKKFDFVEFTIITPYPGTELRKQLNDRIFENNWQNYTILNCVFHPKKMSYKEANEMSKYVHEKFYSMKSILRRMFCTKRLGLFLFGNLTARLALKKL